MRQLSAESDKSMILKGKNTRSDVGYNILVRHDSNAHYVVEKRCYMYQSVL